VRQGHLTRSPPPHLTSHRQPKLRHRYTFRRYIGSKTMKYLTLLLVLAVVLALIAGSVEASDKKSKNKGKGKDKGKGKGKGKERPLSSGSSRQHADDTDSRHSGSDSAGQVTNDAKSEAEVTSCLIMDPLKNQDASSWILHNCCAKEYHLSDRCTTGDDGDGIISCRVQEGAAFGSVEHLPCWEGTPKCVESKVGARHPLIPRYGANCVKKQGTKGTGRPPKPVVGLIKS